MASRRLVAYAASFGNHDAADGLAGHWADPLSRFAAIAVRDDNSRRLIEDALGRPPPVVLDPCLQFDDICRRPGAGDGPVLVYGHSFPTAFGRAARAWADAQGVRLVSIGYRNDWADEQRMAVGPEDFARAFGEASGVLTNFFHGCVFSLVHQRPFACVPSAYRSNKLSALLDAVGARTRLLDPEDCAPCDLDRELATACSAEVQDRLAELRNVSSRYLDEALA